jgi:3-(3-hydroxy-phenyl)propionate hydroxylase
MPPWIGQGMSAGVRDAANLCWKLHAVIKGQAPDSLLDSYQSERKPHVTEVTRRAVLVGRVITERNRVVATIRNHTLRALSRLPGSPTVYQKLLWIPNARYEEGFFAEGGHGAVGWQVPQPWVVDTNGTKVRLDDVLSGQWTILHTGVPPAGTQAWTELGVPANRLAGPQDGLHREAIRDNDGTLTRWLQRKKAAAVVLRPDGFIYAAADSGEPLPPPPSGFTGNTTPVPQAKSGASA